MPTKSQANSEKKPLKDPKGGLTAAGRAHFKKTEGANLKPGVKGAADTPEKQKRKGSFLRRHFANPEAGPLADDRGEPTRHALSAAAWGEPVPKNDADVKKLATKGSELLAQSKQSKGASAKSKGSAAVPGKSPAGKSTGKGEKSAGSKAPGKASKTDKK